MGNASSHNLSKLTTQAVSKVATNIISKTKLTTDNSQIISVSNVSGNVVISGNKFDQKVNLNLSELLNAMVTQTAQQDLKFELDQAAKSITKDINLFNFSDASNTLETYINAAIDVVTNINLTCSGSAQNNQSIVVDHVDGNVLITDNLFSQVESLFANCIMNATSNNSVFQQIQEKVDQSVSATTAGTNIVWIIVALAIFFTLPVVAPILGFKVQYIFPLIVVTGIIMIILYFVLGKKVMVSTGFYKDIPSCIPQTQNDPIQKSPADAEIKCLNTDNCAGYVFENTQPPKTFYWTEANKCAITDSQDKIPLTRIPVKGEGIGNPENSALSANYDLWLDSDTSEWYVKSESKWTSKGRFSELFGNEFGSATWNNSSESDAAYEYVISVSEPNNFVVDYQGNVKTTPGYFLIPAVPDPFNAIGKKSKIKYSWLLWAGIGAITIGSIGSLLSLKFTNKEKNGRAVQDINSRTSRNV